MVLGTKQLWVQRPLQPFVPIQSLLSPSIKFLHVRNCRTDIDKPDVTASNKECPMHILENANKSGVPPKRRTFSSWLLIPKLRRIFEIIAACPISSTPENAGNRRRAMTGIH